MLGESMIFGPILIYRKAALKMRVTAALRVRLLVMNTGSDDVYYRACVHYQQSHFHVESDGSIASVSYGGSIDLYSFSIWIY
jgi:hypothetical protein